MRRPPLSSRCSAPVPVYGAGDQPRADRHERRTYLAVSSLSITDEAVELFTDRARLVNPEFVITDDNAATVAEICQRLDGMPLAMSSPRRGCGHFGYRHPHQPA